MGVGVLEEGGEVGLSEGAVMLDVTCETPGMFV